MAGKFAAKIQFTRKQTPAFWSVVQMDFACHPAARLTLGFYDFCLSLFTVDFNIVF